MEYHMFPNIPEVYSIKSNQDVQKLYILKIQIKTLFFFLQLHL